MIRIACTNCKTVLTIDDAFAGGVCRCQHCGTIQTVPAQPREASTSPVAGQSMGGSKLLYQNDARSGTGLDELAGVVVSSGLASGRLTRGPAPSARPHQNLMPLFIGIGVVILILLSVIVYLDLRTTTPAVNANTGPAVSNNQTSTPTGAPATPVNANFCGTKIEGSTVVYLLDCGVATQEFLGDLKDASLRSLGTLGSEHRFQILFWSNGSDSPVGYPESVTTYATKDSIEAARHAIEDQPAFGQTDIRPALKVALTEHPDVIIIATGKGWDLDTNWVADVMAVRGSNRVPINTFNLGTSDSAALKSLATKTGGTYRDLAKSDLRGE